MVAVLFYERYVAFVLGSDGIRLEGMNELQQKLAKLYPERDKEDVFGRRDATPKEILETISMRVVPDGHNFVNLLGGYEPTQKDIRAKGDGGDSQ